MFAATGMDAARTTTNSASCRSIWNGAPPLEVLHLVLPTGSALYFWAAARSIRDFIAFPWKPIQAGDVMLDATGPIDAKQFDELQNQTQSGNKSYELYLFHKVVWDWFRVLQEQVEPFAVLFLIPVFWKASGILHQRKIWNHVRIPGNNHKWIYIPCLHGAIHPGALPFS